MDSQAKRAVLIGVNRYPNFQSCQQLKGCINDVYLMSTILIEKYGFPASPDNIVLVTDYLYNISISLNTNKFPTAEHELAMAMQQGKCKGVYPPNRANILDMLNWLVNVTRTGDVAVIMFSGHGSRVKATNASGYHETIVPCDSARYPDPNNDILDTELLDIINRLTKVTKHVTVIIDSCFSGHVLRGPTDMTYKTLPVDERPSSRQASLSRDVTRGPSGWMPIRGDYTLLAACLSSESSREYSVNAHGLRHGVWSYALIEALCTRCPLKTYRDWFDDAYMRVTRSFSDQHPQIEGAKDKQIFDTKELPVEYHAKVTAISLWIRIAHTFDNYAFSADETVRIYPPNTVLPDTKMVLQEVTITEVFSNFSTALVKLGPNSVHNALYVGCMIYSDVNGTQPQVRGTIEEISRSITLSLGSVHGVTPGSVYSIWPPLTRSPNDGSGKELDTVTVGKVLADSSIADSTLHSGDADSVCIGCRAFEVGHAYNELSLPITVCVQEGMLNTANVRNSKLLLEELITSSAYLFLKADNGVACTRVVLDLKFGLPMFTVCDAAGVEQLEHPIEINERNTRELAKRLERMGKFHRMLSITNDDLYSMLRGRVKMEILFWNTTWKKWSVLLCEENAVLPQVKVGMRLAVRIHNETALPVHIALFGLDEVGEISMLYPSQHGGDQILAPNSTVIVNDDQKLWNPVSLVSKSHNVERLKLFVSNQPLDLSPLEQASFRGGSRVVGFANALTALCASGKRHLGRNTSTSVDVDWCTVMHGYEIVP